MELILDTSNLEAIQELNDLLTITGVTTNPTIITKSGKDPKELIPQIDALLNPDQLLFVQVIS
ncbi:MAG: fructose-6-phosphate aldolase, partial [Allobaculum sp.]|nr:fructose-6-phosphate aldolase [Allobaculum sp.]